ncbi:MAG: FtsX-like permease family protein [Pleurocapsa sp. SU_5_0]|nr:FtsX-like permease family protein [Pleurocapsa sp. SU_5_0]NJR45935.1 FtsX-like permease family protein [Hyellaceae cyanobacterium CSU_1_1]
MQKLPTAWLQLKYQKVRLIVALSGVVFAVVIVFVQLGIRDALFDSTIRLHQGLTADYFMISPSSTSSIAMETFPERRLSQALAFEEVEYVAPVYQAFAQWRNPENRSYWRNLNIIGIDLRRNILNLPGVEENINLLKKSNTVLFDRFGREEFGPIVDKFEENSTVVTEVRNGDSTRKIEVVGLFELGTSFGFDGNLVTSHLNFLRIVDSQEKGFINIGLIGLKEGSDFQNFGAKLKKYLPEDVIVFTKEEFMNFEKSYWQSSTAIGFIFNLGVFLGIVVGIVVVYQILYTNVSEHLPEYATLKAIGYKNQYLLTIVLQQAFLIAVLGYIPGLLISIIQYEVIEKATLLPVAMTLNRSGFVLVATVLMCAIAGATAVKKLQDADPADIF